MPIPVFPSAVRDLFSSSGILGTKKNGGAGAGQTQKNKPPGWGLAVLAARYERLSRGSSRRN